MPSVRVPGASQSKGKIPPKPYERGWYLLECTGAEVNENDAKEYDRFVFRFSILDGPEQSDPDLTDAQRDPTGKNYTHRVLVLRPDHPSYDKAGGVNQPGVQELGEIAIAAGIELADEIDDEVLQEFVGQQVWFNLGVQRNDFTDSEGQEQTRWENVLYNAKEVE